ncbi:Phage integrase [gamma proteobacterium IMCC1989]|nr:Phage integrase [gamma proteobacterium IMCC1989]
MGRKTQPLSSKQVQQAKAKEKEYNLADGGGLALRIKPNETKSWIFNYTKPYTKKRANISFGLFPDLSLANARRERDKYRELLAQDIDPKEYREQEAEKQREAIDNTLENIARRWLSVKKSKITSNYADDIWNSLQLHIFPHIGRHPIHKITARLAIQTVEPVAAKGSLETVKRLCQRLNEIMVYAVNNDILGSNTLSGISSTFQAPKKRHMPALRPDELPELMQTLTTANIKLTTRCLIEWQLHTMVRPSEAAGTRWAELDIDNQVWNIPAERMKKDRPHRIPLTSQTLALIEVMRPISGDREYLFPADRDYRKHANEQTANAALKRMGFTGRLVAHGLRSIASTTLNEQAFDADIIEAALAHSDNNEVRRAYNRAEYLKRRSIMMAWWSEHIEKAAQGNMSLANRTKALRAV